MNWHFPLITPVEEITDDNLINRVLGELDEFKEEADIRKKGLEALDVLHSTETLVRQFFLKYPFLNVDDLKRETIEKNQKRGYYR